MKGIEHFHYYLFGRQFLVRTDHSCLPWLLNFRCPEGQMARWLEKLQAYDFVVQHRMGKYHGNADALSRRPCAELDCTYCMRLEQKDQAEVQTVGMVLASVGRGTSQEQNASVSDRERHTLHIWDEQELQKTPISLLLFSGRKEREFVQRGAMFLQAAS